MDFKSFNSKKWIVQLETRWEEGMNVKACRNRLLVNQLTRIFLFYMEPFPAFNLQIRRASYRRFS
jgi:hypothetical protein